MITLRNFLAQSENDSGPHVLVAHSAGGLVERYFYGANATLRSNIAGIVTISTPHQGAILADNAAVATAFLFDAQKRFNNALVAIDKDGTLMVFIAGISLGALTGFIGGFGPGIAVGWGVLAGGFKVLEKIPTDSVTFATDAVQLTEAPAIRDLKTTSSLISSLNSTTYKQDSTNDLPRVNVRSYVSPLHGLLRLSADLSNQSPSVFVSKKNQFVAVLRTCRVLGGGFIPDTPGRTCGWALRVAGRLDERWARYTGGSATALSDGVVATARTNYPGLASTAQTNFQPIPDVSHLQTTRDPRTMRPVIDGMFLIGMERQARPTSGNPGYVTPSVTVYGPHLVRPGSTCAWLALPAGIGMPQTISWTGPGTTGEGGERTVTSTAGYFTLQATVNGVSSSSFVVEIGPEAPICNN